MSRELVAALNLDSCKAVLSADGQSYDWPCRLSISVPSTARLASDSYVHTRPRLWRAAHQTHHDSGHAIARGQRGSFSFKSGGEPLAVTSVFCSCEATDA